MTILVTTLQLLGAQVGWHIPNRFTEAIWTKPTSI